MFKLIRNTIAKGIAKRKEERKAHLERVKVLETRNLESVKVLENRNHVLREIIENDSWNDYDWEASNFHEDCGDR